MRKAFPIEAVRASVKRLMSENGDKPKPLATALGLSETGVRDIFLPKTKSVGGPKLQSIAQHYGVTVEDILSGQASTRQETQATESGPDLGIVMLPVQLPNVDVLTDALLMILPAAEEGLDLEERARRIAQSFPSALRAALSPLREQGADVANIPASPARAGVEGQS